MPCSSVTLATSPTPSSSLILPGEHMQAATIGSDSIGAYGSREDQQYSRQEDPQPPCGTAMPLLSGQITDSPQNTATHRHLPDLGSPEEVPPSPLRQAPASPRQARSTGLEVDLSRPAPQDEPPPSQPSVADLESGCTHRRLVDNIFSEPGRDPSPENHDPLPADRIPLPANRDPSPDGRDPLPADPDPSPAEHAEHGPSSTDRESLSERCDSSQVEPDSLPVKHTHGRLHQAVNLPQAHTHDVLPAANANQPTPQSGQLAAIASSGPAYQTLGIVLSNAPELPAPQHPTHLGATELPGPQRPALPDAPDAPGPLRLALLDQDADNLVAESKQPMTSRMRDLYTPGHGSQVHPAQPRLVHHPTTNRQWQPLRRRNKRGFSAENAQKKRAKKTTQPSRSAKRRGPQSKRPSKPQCRRRRLRTHHNRDDTNFVPVLPETSKKRKNDVSSNSASTKRSCHETDPDNHSKPPHRHQTSTSRRHRQPPARQNHYAPHTSFYDNVVLDDEEEQQETHAQSEPSRRQSKRTQSTARTCPAPPGCSPYELPPPRPPTPSTSGRRIEDCYAPSELSLPPLPTPSTSRRRIEDSSSPHSFDDEGPHQDERASSLHEDGPVLGYSEEALPSAAPRRKRRQPDHLSPSPEHPKHRALAAVRRIPTSAQSRHRRQRQQRNQERARRNSLVVPSLYDDPLVPNPHPSSSGVENWRSSLPPDMSSPPVSPRRACHTGGTCLGPQILSQFTRATGRLTECVEALTAATLRPRPNLPQASTSRAPGAQDLSLLARVRQHINTLFGKTISLNQFPPPATARKQARWKRDPANDYSDDESMGSSSSDSGDDADPDADPCFPYPDGPGHQDASAATLKIMWRSMRRSGVVSFRPDLSRGASDTDNSFLWDLCHSIFMKLVRAQEYPQIDLETCSSAKIHQAILNRAKQLRRICKYNWLILLSP
ncbi:hypothetical protein VP01_865g2 [Puccinia sorghi]|uniref:Uncharacterized protein n=1 Tax=Puccinia sorghi TaxID=27349 RepID=A0A0L6U9I6_9BASI|nr:hypothetical protein VP01_865g2 [Puccinia sorghi]